MVLRVDAHCHVSPVWYEPVETLLEQMGRNGVDQAVLVQALGQFDNAYLEQCVRRYPGRFAAVVAVDVARADACTELSALAARGATGVRLRPDARSPGTDPFAVWRTAAQERLAVSCVGSSEKFAALEFAELVALFPQLAIVLEHLGGTNRPEDVEGAALRRRVFELAAYPNVYLKVPGLGELSKRSARLPAAGVALDPRPEILRHALVCFGAERLLWSSDFPVVSSREGYANALSWVLAALGDRSAEERAKIFGDTARRVFRLHDL